VKGREGSRSEAKKKKKNAVKHFPDLKRERKTQLSKGGKRKGGGKEQGVFKSPRGKKGDDKTRKKKVPSSERGTGAGEGEERKGKRGPQSLVSFYSGGEKKESKKEKRKKRENSSLSSFGRGRKKRRTDGNTAGKEEKKNPSPSRGKFEETE